ncbi:hypothetical protein [Streptomyces sp. BoleA5]|uniref:hypothetical protein n=1 Tax=Streptomyces sp. BoleA5 TaxID=1157637 RepID=UPI00037FE167
MEASDRARPERRNLARPAPLTVLDPRAWPQHTARVSFEHRTGGVQHHRFEGPLLHEVL